MAKNWDHTYYMFSTYFHLPNVVRYLLRSLYLTHICLYPFASLLCYPRPHYSSTNITCSIRRGQRSSQCCSVWRRLRQRSCFSIISVRSVYSQCACVSVRVAGVLAYACAVFRPEVRRWKTCVEELTLAADSQNKYLNRDPGLPAKILGHLPKS